MLMIEQYEHETVPILKCPLSRCRWLFALKPDLFPDEIEELVRRHSPTPKVAA